MTKEFVTERLRLIDLYPDKAREVAKEYGLKENEVELIRKGRVSSQPVIDRDARTVINYISTDAIDRDNEVIEHRGVVLDDYVKNPIVPWAHDYRGLPIGKNLWIKPDKKGLVAKTYFLKHDFAEDVFDLYTEDIKGTGPALKAWSVGFIPLKWKDAKPIENQAMDERPAGPRRTYKKWMLLEYSAVPVPSNPEALTLMVEKGLIKNDKLKKDIEDFITETKEKTDQGLIDERFEKQTDGKIRFEEEAGKIEEKEYESLHEVLKDNLQVDYKSAEKFHKHLMSLVTKPEETDDAIRLPVKGESGKHGDHKIRWITVSEEKGIKGLYCIDCKKIITYIFDKKKGWTMAKAKKWMKDHGKDVRIEETVNALTGELGLYIICGDEDSTEDLGIKEKETEEESKEEGIAKTEFSEDGVRTVKDLVEEVYGEDLQELREEITSLKEGRVLSGKNLKLVKDCKEQIDKVGELLSKLIVASEPPEPPKEESILPLIEESKSKDNGIDSLTKDDVPVIVEETLKGLIEAMSGQHKEIQKLFDNKRGKVS